MKTLTRDMIHGFRVAAMIVSCPIVGIVGVKFLTQDATFFTPQVGIYLVFVGLLGTASCVSILLWPLEPSTPKEKDGK